MTIAYEGAGLCTGCRVPVYVYRDAGREVTRDVGEFRTRHMCADPEKREGVEDPFGTTRPFPYCPFCGSKYVRWSTWGRLVEWEHSMMINEWLEPLQQHVCDKPASNVSKRATPLHGVEVFDL